MEKRTDKKIKKVLIFEKSGETLSVEICLENVSPKQNVASYLDALYAEALEELIY